MTKQRRHARNFESIRSHFFIGGATLLRFAAGMSAGNTEDGETMNWYVEPDHFGARRTALSLSRRRRHADECVNSLAFAVTAALLFVLVAGAVMFGGRIAIAPLLPRNGADADRTGSIVYAMPDGVFCRRMAFDNSTAEVTSVAVERCPGAIGVAGGPAGGRFDWGHH